MLQQKILKSTYQTPWLTSFDCRGPEIPTSLLNLYENKRFRITGISNWKFHPCLL